MTLSSYLSERTGDPTIKLEAIRSAKCIRKHMLDSTTFLAKDCIFDADNSREKENATLSCHLTGIAIEGFTVLADITGSDDWRKLAISMAQNAMATSQWHGRDGILLVGSESKLYINDDLKALKGLLARGLLTLYQRNPTNKPLRNSIRKYINVQVCFMLPMLKMDRYSRVCLSSSMHLWTWPLTETLMVLIGEDRSSARTSMDN
ncbi:hypothetical protein FRC03_012784 [Tulasnella sp. 419]|nr:hypothetical protein FRC03_012784 [Tulasnella sp. 419]